MSRLVTPDESGLAPVARVNGEIDLANAARLQEELMAMAADAEALVVDLTAVPYLDSAGVKALFQVAWNLRQQERALLVTVPIGSPLRRMLKITGFHEVTTICDDLEAAFNLIDRP